MREIDRRSYDVTVGLVVRNISEIEYETVESIMDQKYPHSRIELVLVLSKIEPKADKIRKLLSEVNITTEIFCETDCS